ncbi:MAG TPA: serine hydrolase domain-containing protein [Streptosporangiaceae bacterium]|nr:serine hydrolase domain-containing protein [Streptosporangiaceae bacterium]
MQHVIGGWCDPRFGAVRDEFAANFAERGELGAAVSVAVGGTMVVDLYGGLRDPGHRWQQDTLVNVFSVGKGVLAVCLARLSGQGRLDPDARVSSYWPEFAAAGKQDVTVRQLLSHQAGLPALHAPLAAGSMLDWDLMTSVLAAEEPWWQPGSGHGYHVNTFGFLGGELLRRITGMSPAEYLRREVAGPLSADLYFGVPSGEQGRVAEFRWDPGRPPPKSGPSGAADPAGADPASTAIPATTMAMNAYFNPPDFSGAGVVNTAAWRGAQIPSANAHATSAGIAALYAALGAGPMAGGPVAGGPVVDAAALAAATEEQVYGQDLVLQRPSRFGLGFQLTHPEREFGRGPGCFGHFGAGGSVGFLDPDAGLAFGYVTNQMGPRWRNPRNRALIDACYACL